ncbi:MAG: VIT domain-containing protein [Thermodesulfobacteriota bacterium]
MAIWRPRTPLWCNSRLGALALLLAGLLILGLKPLPHHLKSESSGQEDKTLSPYFVVLSDDSEKDSLPLKSTRADVKIAGKVADVTVTQVYKNQGRQTLEAIYVFPGSTRAAVHALRMTVGERVIEAQVMERQKARQTYEDAKKAGQTTSLLEQQRPNVFQMNVANILPGDEIKVELKYLELLQAEDRVYEFVYPTVVGPRYSKLPAAGAPDTEKWVENPYLHQGQAPPYAFDLAVEVRGGLPLAKLASPSHDIKIKYDGPQVARVTLQDNTTGGNRDFVLRYTLAGDKIDAGLLLYPGKEENFFLMVLEPPERVTTKTAVPREYIFIVDVSGSMNGYPLDTAKALMQDIIRGLRPQDSMNVLLFAGGADVLSESKSLPATEDNKQRALEFIKARHGGGGTNILPALKQALALPRTEGTSRIVVVATDGYVRVEPEVFDLIRQNLGEANLFPFGIGTSVNRFLIEGMARAGQGEPFVVLKPEEAAQQAARFQLYVETPVLTGLNTTFQGFEAYDVEPPGLPDLFALRPLTLLGKYKGQPRGTIVITGKTAAGEFRREVKVEDSQASPDNVALKYLWARERIRRLSDYQGLSRGQDEAGIKKITDLGLQYNLMTAYTSFVAVDKVKRADGTVETVKQPLPLPQGVSDLAVGKGGPMASRAPMPYEAVGTFAGSLRSEDLEASGIPGGEGKQADKPSTGLNIKILRVRGKLEGAVLQETLEKELSRLEKCFRLAKVGEVKGPRQITLQFTLSVEGKVTAAKVLKPNQLPSSLTDCLVKALQRIAFPKPGEGKAEVEIMLILSGSADSSG